MCVEVKEFGAGRTLSPGMPCEILTDSKHAAGAGAAGLVCCCCLAFQLLPPSSCLLWALPPQVA